MKTVDERSSSLLSSLLKQWEAANGCSLEVVLTSTVALPKHVPVGQSLDEEFPQTMYVRTDQEFAFGLFVANQYLEEEQTMNQQIRKAADMPAEDKKEPSRDP